VILGAELFVELRHEIVALDAAPRVAGISPWNMETESKSFELLVYQLSNARSITHSPAAQQFDV
jgi:hypothetical protein